MKKFLAMVIGMALLSTACSKEETSSTNPNNNAPASATLEEALPGTWDVTKVEQKNGVSDFGGIQVTFSGVGKDINATMTFNADGTCNSKGSYTMDLTMSFMGQSIPQSQSLVFDNDANWSVNTTGELVLEAPGESPVPYTVLSRTDTKLELKARVQTQQEFQGQTSLSTVDLYLTLEK